MQDINIYDIYDFGRVEDCNNYIVTSKPCRDIIDDAIHMWYEYLEKGIEIPDCYNVFDCIEKKLKGSHIDYKWIKFDDTNTINF